MSRIHIDPILPTGQDAQRAKDLRHALEHQDAASAPLRVQLSGGATLDLPPIVSRLLMDILEETAAGNAVTLVPVETEITTQQAADLLNVSRPYLVTLVENGTLPARMVGKHRRLALCDVLAYKADHFAKRSKVLDEMLALDQELGLI
jgi:excisionase family DNA binding protein